ncbi:MAG TPA: ABC transporter ATP-binding protein [Vicinamibacterales bacterium]|nr:ABC transporter ATP-binding protein [Vicinamibacterales bacterium]
MTTLVARALRSPKVLSIAGLLRPHWIPMTVALVAVAGEIAATVLEPWPLKIVLDYLLQSRPLPHWMTPVTAWVGGGNVAVLNLAVLAVGVIAVLGAAASYANTALTAKVGQWIMHDLRRTLYHHIHRLSLAEHDEKRTGDLIGRVTSDIDSIQSFVTTTLIGMVTNALTLVGIIGVMFYWNWRFTLISLAIAPVLFLVVYGFTRRIKKTSRDVRKKESELVSIVAEVFSSIRVVKAFAREEYEERRFEQQSLENVEAALIARNIKMTLAPVVDIIVATGTCLMLWYGARLVLAGELTAGALVVFLSYLKGMYQPMRDLSKATDTVSKAGVGFERIREVLETEGGVRDRRGARTAAGFKGAIAFDHVSFGYGPDTVILDDVSFAIEAGQVAAFVGPTGGGKTTIINMIARFYDPVSGTVTIDGTDIRAFTIRSLREQISFVLQDTLLFHAPIWQNIAYGRPDAARADVIRAAELANAHEFIAEMPEGYDTMVGERGVTLSGGQRQRIAIARAVIRNTPILVLDEPTSGLDAHSEQVVFEALDRLMKGKTCIVIAHHLATIRSADVIFVVKDHHLAERGTHEELMAAGGFYAELHGIQFAQPAAM